MDYVKHWNNLYSSKKLEEVSWYQKKPKISLDFICDANLNKDDAIIDVGGGDSFLIDYLIKDGYTNITVLDISKIAIDRAKSRLGDNAQKVDWIVCDIKDFNPPKKYVLWHDRAVFHFMNNSYDIKKYYNSLLRGVIRSSTLIVGAFSEYGPNRCCDLDVCRYSIQEMSSIFSKDFNLISAKNILHKTPFGSSQDFNFLSFTKK